MTRRCPKTITQLSNPTPKHDKQQALNRKDFSKKNQAHVYAPL
jgi:hypothetical protein